MSSGQSHRAQAIALPNHLPSLFTAHWRLDAIALRRTSPAGIVRVRFGLRFKTGNFEQKHAKDTKEQGDSREPAGKAAARTGPARSPTSWSSRAAVQSWLAPKGAIRDTLSTRFMSWKWSRSPSGVFSVRRADFDVQLQMIGGQQFHGGLFGQLPHVERRRTAADEDLSVVARNDQSSQTAIGSQPDASGQLLDPIGPPQKICR